VVFIYNGMCGLDRIHAATISILPITCTPFLRHTTVLSHASSQFARGRQQRSVNDWPTLQWHVNVDDLLAKRQVKEVIACDSGTPESRIRHHQRGPAVA
jgi:hypothetical protein